jgi:myo-inositol 2-dehydrogenase/D-chiro-inositol 1-dehydrogenase
MDDSYPSLCINPIFVAAKTYGVPKFTSDAMEVITDPEVDAVWICSPSQFHADQIKACAANGKHVFCEKPIATDLAETVEAINACNEAGVKLMIGLQRRFDPNFLRVKTAIQNKEVGDTIIVSSLCIVSAVFFFSIRLQLYYEF